MCWWFNDIYGGELGEFFIIVGLCYYCDGFDSVVWYGDIIGCGSIEDIMVVIVSFGVICVFVLWLCGCGLLL